MAALVHHAGFWPSDGADAPGHRQGQVMPMQLFPHQQKALDDLYSVDAAGNVYSTKTTNSRRKGRLKPYLCNGYLRVNLYAADGKCHKEYIHRLVAQLFIPNPKKLPVVNHIDGDKLNNDVSNLEWCSQQDNIHHSFKNRLEKRSKPTVVITATGTKYEYPNMKEASLVFFDNVWEIAVMRRKLKKDEFYYGGHLIKVGDAACQG